MQCLIISGLLDFSFVLNDPLGALPHPVHSSKYQYFIYPYPFLGGTIWILTFFMRFCLLLADVCLHYLGFKSTHSF